MNKMQQNCMALAAKPALKFGKTGQNRNYRSLRVKSRQTFLRKRLARLLQLIIVGCMIFTGGFVSAEEGQTTASKLEALKKEVLSVNRDLFILEEDLLFPASTQVAVYLSIDVGQFFALDNVKLKIDDKEVTHYLYTERDVDALHRGAIQKLYLDNLSAGTHQIVAIILGTGPHNREYRNAIAFDFEKGSEAKALEIQIRDDTSKLQPRLNVVEW
ncbi:AraC family transcriptional regulator [Aliikangiella sp. G2MR2-5]|uniref:AraC family transcriptional regulator n=1 Tax=Aliikangiella sp. G2MR2-5 TaxID=2788943 RepID=UPI001AED3313|nr:AraC family transcriptional regulator [Aliikangiella sp. G2MR2-5]